MDTTIRPYKTSDYDGLVELYKDSTLYGGQFSEERDSKESIERITAKDTYAVMVAEKEGEIVGTISLIENERIAWLYRFCVADVDGKAVIEKALYDRAEELLIRRGHKQVLVYTSPGEASLHERYAKLGFSKGNDYTCFWKDV